MANTEGAETSNSNALSFLKLFGYRVKNSFECITSNSFANTGSRSYSSN